MPDDLTPEEDAEATLKHIELLKAKGLTPSSGMIPAAETRPRVEMPPPEAEFYFCLVCHDAGWVRHEAMPGDVDFGKAFPCPDCSKRRARWE